MQYVIGLYVIHSRAWSLPEAAAASPEAFGPHKAKQPMDMIDIQRHAF